MFDPVALLAELTRDEDFRGFVYDDATGQPIVPGSKVIGHPTIGIGRALDVRGITLAEGAFLEGDDVSQITATLDAVLPWWSTLDPVRQRVVIEMSFNMGVTGLLAFHNTLSCLQSGNYAGASDGMLASKWANQVGARALRLADMMRNGTT